MADLHAAQCQARIDVHKLLGNDGEVGGGDFLCGLLGHVLEQVCALRIAQGLRSSLHASSSWYGMLCLQGHGDLIVYDPTEVRHAISPGTEFEPLALYHSSAPMQGHTCSEFLPTTSDATVVIFVFFCKREAVKAAGTTKAVVEKLGIKQGPYPSVTRHRYAGQSTGAKRPAPT
jgi:hypothetical protein